VSLVRRYADRITLGLAMMLRELEILKPIAIMNPAWIIQSRGAYFDIKNFLRRKFCRKLRMISSLRPFFIFQSLQNDIKILNTAVEIRSGA